MASQVISDTQNYRLLGICENIPSFFKNLLVPSLVAAITEVYLLSRNRIFGFICIVFTFKLQLKFRLSRIGKTSFVLVITFVDLTDVAVF